MKPVGASRTTLWRRRKAAERAVLRATGVVACLRVRKGEVKLVPPKKKTPTIDLKLLFARLARRRASKLSKSVMRQDSCLHAGIPSRELEKQEKAFCVPLSFRSVHVPKAAFAPILAKLQLIVQTFERCKLWDPPPSSEVHMRLAVDGTVNPKLTHIAVAPTCVPKVHSYMHYHSLVLYHGKEDLKVIQTLCKEAKLNEAAQSFKGIPIKWFLTADHVGHQVMAAVSPACVSSPNVEQCPWCEQTREQRHNKNPFQQWPILEVNRASVAFPFIPPNRRIPCLIHGGMNVLGWVLNGTMEILVNVQHGGKTAVQNVVNGLKGEEKWKNGTLSITASEMFLQERMYQKFMVKCSEIDVETCITFQGGKSQVSTSVYEALNDLWNCLCASYTLARVE